MRIADIIRQISNLFEKKKKNPIQLDNDSNLESNLKFLKVGDKSTPIQMSEDTINVNGDLKVNGSAVQAGETIASVPDLNLNPTTGKVNFQSNGATVGYIDTSGSTMKIEGEDGRHIEIKSIGSGDVNIQSEDNITIDATDTLVIDTDGTFIMKKDGTEFSVANSAYAGMILGYRMIGEDAGHDAYALTTSFAVPDAAMTVRFVAPPSGNVEVMIQIYANSVHSNRSLTLALSDNATFNTLGATYEQAHRLPDETDDNVVQHYWTVTGLTAGTTYNYWLGAKTSATTSYLNWGGTSTSRYCDFIMKVTALPADTSDFAEYD